MPLGPVVASLRTVSASNELIAPTLIAAAPATPADARPAGSAGALLESSTALFEQRSDILAGRYRIDGVLAEGGMATVYRAWHCLLERPVALKMLRPEFSSVPEIAERFLHEARAVARLRSKHAVRVMDFGGTAEGGRYMVLELLNGKDLQQLLSREGAQPVARAVDFVLQAAEAVAEAHATGLVHRDIKPANLFLAKEDGAEIIKVIDFGICKSLCRKSEYRTLSKSYLGSPQYMSPEQIQSAASVDARTDIWALGVVLYELVTGQVPFRGATLPALCASVMTDTPIWPQHLPPALRRIVMRCLAKRREDRYATVAALAAELAGFLGASALPPASGLPTAPPHSNVRARTRIDGWPRKAVPYGVIGILATVLGWGFDAVHADAPASRPLPSALVAAALEPLGNAPGGPPVEPVLVEPASLVAAASPAPFDALAVIDSPQLPPDSAPASGALERPARPATMGTPEKPTGGSSTVEMEARYALTYQPDAVQSKQPMLMSGDRSVPSVPDPALSDL